MKKAIIYFSITINIFHTNTCSSNNIFIKEDKNKPPIFETKDINYYQNLIKENQKHLLDLKEMIKEINKTKNEYENDKDYQSEIDEIIAEQFLCQANIAWFKYQIILLKASNETNQSIILLNDYLDNKQQELNLKNKYSSYYSAKELQEIIDDIDKIKIILENIIKNQGGK